MERLRMVEDKRQKNKIAKVMKEYKKGILRSGSKKGPAVKKPKQAVAIAMSEAGVKRKSRLL